LILSNRQKRYFSKDNYPLHENVTADFKSSKSKVPPIAFAKKQEPGTKF
jgi:hypothetical protein